MSQPPRRTGRRSEDSTPLKLLEDVFPFCALPLLHLRVDCEGNAFTCCFQRDKGIGNLLEKSLDEVWFGPLAEELRRETLAGKLHAICHVGGCPFGDGRSLRPGVPRDTAYPVRLEIDLPNFHCNIGGPKPSPSHPACLMCERSAPGYRFHPRNRLPEVLECVAPLLPGLLSIHIQGVAESFWKDSLFEVLDQLQFDPRKHRAIVSTVTNGLVVTRNRARKFLKHCPRSTIAFSLDAATPETYRKLRRLDAYERVLENLMAYAEERRGTPTAGLTIQNNINLLNVSEVSGMLEVAARAHVDRVDFSPTGGHATEILVNEDNAHLFEAAEKSIRKEAKRLGLEVSFLSSLSRNPDRIDNK